MSVQRADMPSNLQAMTGKPQVQAESDPNQSNANTQPSKKKAWADPEDKPQALPTSNKPRELSQKSRNPSIKPTQSEASGYDASKYLYKATGSFTSTFKPTVEIIQQPNQYYEGAPPDPNKVLSIDTLFS